MKKVFVCIVALTFIGNTLVCSIHNGALVSIDSIAIMQKSIEGQELATKMKREIDTFQEELKKAHKELSDMQESLNKQSKIISQESMQEKAEELNQKRKKLEREFADKEEALRVSLQKKQVALREKQLAVITEVSEKAGCSAVIDVHTPGLLYVSNTIDQTDKFLKAVDEKFNANKAKVASSKTATIRKAEAAPKHDSVKPSIKAV